MCRFAIIIIQSHILFAIHLHMWLLLTELPVRLMTKWMFAVRSSHSSDKVNKMSRTHITLRSGFFDGSLNFQKQRKQYNYYYSYSNLFLFPLYYIMCVRAKKEMNLIAHSAPEWKTFSSQLWKLIVFDDFDLELFFSFKKADIQISFGWINSIVV